MTEVLSGLAAFIWVLSALLPWQPWRTREVLETDGHLAADLSDITVLIPARNEAEVIAETLQSLKQQGQGLHVLLVDDESHDSTAQIARQVGLESLQIIQSKPLSAGWTGKLWAQEQGLQVVQTSLTLLLDADIYLKPGIVSALKAKRDAEGLQFVSLMAMLKVDSFWEKMLMPAFIYFFKMLYPFALANKPDSKVAAAAGGCILVDTQALHAIGGMAAIKDAVIDDCTLAKKIKQAGYKTWVGLTNSVISQRPYVSLREIWDMVARTAYTQLFYSNSLLLVCTVLMSLMYLLPLYGVIFFTGLAWLFAVLAMLIMLALYLPTLRFYALNSAWAFCMPVIAGLYLLMTWTSALRYWRGERSRWKGRIYQKG
ncbi:glycosyltransferase [Methyloprofundus sp.]|uniref:glycosyltransferase n=1 Tax=Methyloprofundus sp. TaxID=2020875 RepID=UPI003D0BDA57